MSHSARPAAHDEDRAGGGRWPRLGGELVAHLPFSVSAVSVGLIFAGLVCVGLDRMAPALETDDGTRPHVAPASAPQDDHEAHHDDPATLLFHLFHPAHMLFSAAATTAMFWRYDRRWLKAMLTGLAGAIGVCGISDIVMPHLSALILNPEGPITWHICIIEHPKLVMPFAAVGVVLGLVAALGIERSTFFSHSLHVLASTMASIFYLVRGFGGLTEWIDGIGTVFFFVVLAVMIPCCVSDIVFPLLLTERGRRAHDEAGCGHCH